MLGQTLSFFRNLALCLWLGELFFFAAIFAPRVFKILEREDAAQLQSALFPPYYTVGLICGLVILATTLLQRPFFSKFQFSFTVLVAFVGSLVSAYCLYYITPTLVGLYPDYYTLTPAPEIIEKFARLHEISVFLNATVMIGLLVSVFLLSERRQKRVWS